MDFYHLRNKLNDENAVERWKKLYRLEWRNMMREITKKTNRKIEKKNFHFYLPIVLLLFAISIRRIFYDFFLFLSPSCRLQKTFNICDSATTTCITSQAIHWDHFTGYVTWICDQITSASYPRMLSLASAIRLLSSTCRRTSEFLPSKLSN